MAAYAICVSILPTTCLTFGTYWLEQSIVREIVNDYRILNDKVSDLNRKEVLELFYKIIENISEAKQLSDRFSSTENCSLKFENLSFSPKQLGW